MAGWYELSSNDKGTFSFVLRAGNGEVILRSEQYDTKASAENGIKSVQTNSPQEARSIRSLPAAAPAPPAHRCHHQLRTRQWSASALPELQSAAEDLEGMHQSEQRLAGHARNHGTRGA